MQRSRLDARRKDEKRRKSASKAEQRVRSAKKTSVSEEPASGTFAAAEADAVRARGSSTVTGKRPAASLVGAEGASRKQQRMEAAAEKSAVYSSIFAKSKAGKERVAPESLFMQGSSDGGRGW